MPFVRHELGQTLRIRSASRTCTSSSTTPPSGARASCSCSTSSRPGDVRPTTTCRSARRCRPRCRACRHEGDTPEEPPLSGDPAEATRDVARRRTRGEPTVAQAPMTVDLAAVPRRRPGRRRRADPRRAARARGRPREPRRRHARGDARRRRASSRRWAARPTRSAPTRSRRCTTSSPASSGSGPIPDPDGRLRPARRLRLRHRSIGSATSADRHAELFERLPRVVIDHHASNDAAGDADWIEPDAAATCEMVALLAVRLGLPLDARRRGPGRRADGRHRHGHRDLRPPECDAADPGRGRPRWSRPARRSPTSRGASTDRSRRHSCGCSVGSSIDSRASTAVGSSIRRCSTPTSRRPAPSRRNRKGSSTCSRSRTRPRSRSSSRRPSPATRISVRTKPGGVDATVLTGAFGGGGHARAAGATVQMPIDEATDRGPRRGPAARRPGHALTVAHNSLGPGLDGILVVDKPIGPTSHDIVGLVRKLAATKRVGHGGTLDPFASGVLPVFLGRGTRVVEFHLGDRKRVPGDGLLRGVIDDGRPRGRADAGGRPGADPRRGRGGTPRVDRHDLAAAARVFRDQGRRAAGLRDGQGRGAGHAGPARRSRSTS